jgi:hypothetical protein
LTLHGFEDVDARDKRGSWCNQWLDLTAAARRAMVSMPSRWVPTSHRSRFFRHRSMDKGADHSRRLCRFAPKAGAI